MAITTTSALKFDAMPSQILRVEGLALFAGAVALYIHMGGAALLFFALLFAPDLSMLGYLGGTAWGARVYNLAHTTTVPVLLIALALAANVPTLLLAALVWLAHIGMDRCIGYGLKYATAFKDTHLQRLSS